MKKIAVFLLVSSFILSGCKNETKKEEVKKPLEEEKVMNPFPEWAKDSTIYEVNVRQYTNEGTFKAFQKQLPRLKEMGVEILWFMPIHPISKEKRLGTLGSYYAISDFKATNPEFGTSEDFKAIVDEAHSLGMKVVMDWVANHTGWDHPWIKEHSDWYSKDTNGNIIIPPGTTWNDVAELNYENQDMRKEMIDSMMYWVKEFDIDGFRADHAAGVPTDFWNEAVTSLEKEKELFMLAEDDTVKANMVQAFNANYGFKIHHKTAELAKNRYILGQLRGLIQSNQMYYSNGTVPMLFTTNHDENSWNGTALEKYGDAEDSMAALTFVLPGIPLIYSGQEAHLTKRLEFFEKDPIDWSDLSKQSFYQQLVQLKKDNVALHNSTYGGDLQILDLVSKDFLVFKRTKDQNEVVSLFNMTNVPLTYKVENEAMVGTYKKFPSNEEIKIEMNQTLTFKPWEYLILTK